MNKIIYNTKLQSYKATKLQSNKIALALLALGCVVSSLVGAAGPAITRGGKGPDPITDDQITRFISNNPDVAKLHILPFISIEQLDAQESFDWCKEQDPASRTLCEVTRWGRHMAPMENPLYNKITGDLDIKKNTLSTKDFEKYITHFLAAYADILCKNISEPSFRFIIVPALIRCKTKYDIQAVVPISSSTPECEEAWKLIEVIIENSFNLVMKSGESSIEGEMDKFRKFLAENKNVLFLGYSDKLASSEKGFYDEYLGRLARKWYDIYMITEKFRKFLRKNRHILLQVYPDRLASLTPIIDALHIQDLIFPAIRETPLMKLYEQMTNAASVYEDLLLNRPRL
jgi:hypothetical protein